MKFTACQYHLPFVRPLKISNTSFTHREGLILRYDSGSHTFWGEVAPLPGFSKESLPEVIGTLKKTHEQCRRALSTDTPVKAIKEIDETCNIPPSLAFGLDSLAYQIKASREKISPRNYLFKNFRKQLTVNALGNLLTGNPLQAVGEKMDEGFQTIKFKIGRDFSRELRLLRKIRSKFPKLSVRVDANRAWSLQEALKFGPKLAALNIEYCEEPLREASADHYEQLYRHTHLPLAIDESLIKTDEWPSLLPFTSHAIIKPMLWGRFANIFETKPLLNTHGNKTVFTTCLESGIGRRVTATLASGTGTPETAHGLSTGKLLAEDPCSDARLIRNGKYQVPDMSDPMCGGLGQWDKFSKIKIEQ